MLGLSVCFITLLCILRTQLNRLYYYGSINCTVGLNALGDCFSL